MNFKFLFPIIFTCVIFFYGVDVYAWNTSTNQAQITLYSPNSSGYSLSPVNYYTQFNVSQVPKQVTGVANGYLYTVNQVCVLPYYDRVSYNGSGGGLVFGMSANFTTQLLSFSPTFACQSLPANGIGTISLSFNLPLGAHTIGTLVVLGYGSTIGTLAIESTIAQDFTPVPVSVVSTLPPLISFYSNSATATVGGSTTLIWGASYATSCTASGDWSGSKTTAVTSLVLPAYTAAGTYTYNLSCTGAGGTITAPPKVVTVTSPTAVPTITTPTVASITTSGATLGANVTSLGNPATITARGTCWGTTASPTTNCVAEGGTTTGIFTHARASMTANTTYYYRGYATNSTGTGYSADGSFTTTAVPTITTPTVASITTSGATLGANVTSLGNPATITARGTCWGTTASPTTNCVAEGGTTTGIFTHARASMTANTTYYYRGYATNSTGTGYSADGSFTTKIVPTVTSPTVTSITASGAIVGANVTSLGNPAVITARGICLGTTTNPITSCISVTGTTTGIFTQARGLASNTTYYYRGYATNSAGTGYSADGTFKTMGAPTVTTPTVTSITTSGATLGANVTSLGNPATITARGTCWGTTINPTTNCVAATGVTTGIFAHTQTGMTPATTYYYRGYATNSAGTGYSANGTFMTNSVPTVTTPTAASITTTGATLGANVTSLGLPLPASITARGTCWGTTANPTTNCIAATGVTIGTFTHARTGLTANTTYYYRGYATNSTGTGYSADGSFTTSIDTPTPPTISGPTTLTTGQSGTYSFVSTDPQGQQVTYAVDWNSDGTDLWMPYGSVPPLGGMTYVNSGVSQSASKSWSTPGTYTVRVLAQDYSGNNSAWTTYTITVSDPQPCTAGVVDSSGSWSPTCSTSATCLTPPSPAQLTNQPGIQIGICPTPGYTGNAYRSCSTATITCTPATTCGDNICNVPETILTCPTDCNGRYQQF